MKAVILAGGKGTRLWPMSTDSMPKQFQPIVGKKTMLQETFERLSFLAPADIFVATNSQYAELIKKQLKSLRLENLIIEPAMRDTGPSICHAAHHLSKMGLSKEIMAIIYADHLMQRNDQFKTALLRMEKHIKKCNTLGVIGVRAKYPNPNLGYIKIGKMVEETAEGFEIYELDSFVEKPDMNTAKKFLNSYKYLWNTGLYIFKVSSILKLFNKFAPKIYEAVVKKGKYEAAPKISVDYAIMEKINPKHMHVLPAELGWNDIGNWAALHEELAGDENSNVNIGEILDIKTEGSVIIGQTGKLIATYGIKNLVIIDTQDALLVIPKEKAAEVKHLVEEIKKRKR